MYSSPAFSRIFRIACIAFTCVAGIEAKTYKYDAEWQQLSKQTPTPYGTDSIPTVRYSHAAVQWRDEMITTHGYFYDRKTGNPTWLDDTWGFSLIAPYEWRKIVPRGGFHGNASGIETPFGRYAHAVAVVGDHLYIQGGTDGGERLHGGPGFQMKMEFDDFWRLDLNSDTWQRLDRPQARGPGQRYLHSACAIANRYMFVYGGSNSSSLFRYDTVSDKWTQIVPAPGESWPGHRQGHAMVPLPATTEDNGFLVFGGTRWNWDDKKLLNDVWVYSVNRKRWTEIHARDPYSVYPEIPVPRLYHHMMELDDGRVAMMGGSSNTPGMVCQADAWVYSARHNDWIQLPDAPLKIYHHTVVTHSPSNSMFIFGGHACGADKPDSPAYQNAVWKLKLPPMEAFDHEAQEL